MQFCKSFSQESSKSCFNINLSWDRQTSSITLLLLLVFLRLFLQHSLITGLENSQKNSYCSQQTGNKEEAQCKCMWDTSTLNIMTITEQPSSCGSFLSPPSPGPGGPAASLSSRNNAFRRFWCRRPECVRPRIDGAKTSGPWLGLCCSRIPHELESKQISESHI